MKMVDIRLAMFVDAYVKKVAGTFFHQMDLFLIGTTDALTGDFVCTRKHVITIRLFNLDSSQY